MISAFTADTICYRLLQSVNIERMLRSSPRALAEPRKCI